MLQQVMDWLQKDEVETWVYKVDNDVCELMPLLGEDVKQFCDSGKRTVVLKVVVVDEKKRQQFEDEVKRRGRL